MLGTLISFSDRYKIIIVEKDEQPTIQPTELTILTMGLYLFCVSKTKIKNKYKQCDLRVHFIPVHVWKPIESPEQLLTGK